MNSGKLSFQLMSDFLVDPKNPIRFIGGRIIANVRAGVLERWIAEEHKGLPLTTPRIDRQALGRLLMLNQAAARGYLEDRCVDLYKEIQIVLGTHVKECANLVDQGNVHGGISEYFIKSLFFPGIRLLKPVTLVDLNTLSFEELVARVDRLEQILREFTFYKYRVNRRLELDDSFKLLRLIMKARRKGSLSFEVPRYSL